MSPKGKDNKPKAKRKPDAPAKKTTTTNKPVKETTAKRKAPARKRKAVASIEATLPVVSEQPVAVDLTPAAEPGPPPVPEPNAPPLPTGYGHDRIALLVRDPNCLFAYWDLTGDAFGGLVSARGEDFVNRCSWALRVHNHTQGAHHFQPVGVETGSWYLEVVPSTTYSVDIGLVAPDGAFLSVASSKQVSTPRDSISDRIDEEWTVSEAQFEKMFDLSGGNTTMGASESISSVGLQRMRERVALQLKEAISSRRK